MFRCVPSGGRMKTLGTRRGCPSSDPCGEHGKGTGLGNAPPYQLEENRQRFYKRLARIDHKQNRDSCMQELVDAWRELGGAVWAGLWLWNRLEECFELVAVGHQEGWTKSFEDLPDPKKGSLCDLACRMEGPIHRDIEHDADHVADKNGNGDIDKVCKEFLRRLGTPVFTLNSIGPTDDQGDPGSDCTTGVLSLHYREPIKLPEKKKLDYLQFAARMVGPKLDQMELWHRTAIAHELNAFTEKYLTQFGRRSTDVRARYLKALSPRIREWIGVQRISIFWRDEFTGDELVCIHTTGLRHRDGSFIHSRQDFGRVMYSEGNTRTWRVYSSGKEEMVSNGDSYGESVSFEAESTQDTPICPVLISPIGRIVDEKVPADGTYGWDGATDRAADDADGGRRGTLGVIRCVGPHPVPFCTKADRKFNDVQLRTLEQILTHISPVLHTFEQRIKRENEVAVIRHDMLAPLVAIRDSADYLDAVVGTAGWPEGDRYYLYNLKMRALRLAVLADQLRNDPISTPDLDPRTVNIESKIIAPMKRMMYHYAELTSKMSIWYEGFECLPPLNIDVPLVERAVYNLVVNAVKYGERGSQIRIVASVQPGGYAIDVTNEGPGISEGDSERVFLPGFRTRTARASREGTGLGLAIVRDIMRSHQGDVTLFNDKGRTVFRLSFPSSRAASGSGRS